MPDNNLIQQILRSLCANTVEEQEIATDNFRTTNFSLLDFDGKPKKFLDIVQKCLSHLGGPPSIETVAKEATKSHDLELSMFAEEVGVNDPLWGANYQTVLKQYVEERGTERLKGVLQEAAQIVSEGRQLKGAELQKGLADAIQHVLVETVDLQRNTDPTHRAMSTEEAVDFLSQEYISRRDQPTMAYGLATGLMSIDEATKGGQLGEMWVIGGFTSHGKSTFALHWSRYLAIEGGFNVLIFSLEMSKKQVWRVLACGHSSHPKWERPPLDYEKIKSGTLNKEDEAFYLNEVLPDLKNPEYGRIEVETPSGHTTMSEIRARAEVINRTYPLDMILIDYIGLLGADKGKGKSDRRQIINDNLVAAKQMALEFDHGNGILVLAPHQINRQGFKKASENAGIYEIEALSDANEAERSSDVVLTIYQDVALRQKKEAVICNLKNRDGRLVTPFNIYMPAEHKFVADLATPGEGGPKLDDILSA